MPGLTRHPAFRREPHKKRDPGFRRDDGREGNQAAAKIAASPSNAKPKIAISFQPTDRSLVKKPAIMSMSMDIAPPYALFDRWLVATPQILALPPRPR